jgi:hypothetical protein
MLRATPQLSAQPCSSSGLLFEHSRDSPGDTRLPAGVCTLDPYSLAVPTSATFELSRVTSRGPPSGPRAATMASQLCISRDSVVSLASLHPCQQAARFLVHTRPPDHCGLFVSADHADTPALCIASFVTNALLSPRALDWIQSWILRTSVLEWEYLSAEQKQQPTAMREAWLSGYIKPSEAILQHWLWKFLTRQFAHLHKTQAFAAMLYRTTVAPVQALFDAGCTDYADDRAHIAIAPLLRNSSVTAMNLPTTTATLDPRP